MATYKATLPEQPTRNAINRANDKETTDRFLGMAIIDGKPQVIVDARWYMGRRADGAGNLYCSVWVWGKADRYYSGNGTAGGCGYCKRSAALESAFRSAGITFDKEVGGTGRMVEAITAVGEALGYETTVIT
jgi:hypothetical protein